MRGTCPEELFFFFLFENYNMQLLSIGLGCRSLWLFESSSQARHVGRINSAFRTFVEKPQISRLQN